MDVHSNTIYNDFDGLITGVQTAETEFSSGKVKVTGTMDANELVDYVYKSTRKQAKIAPQPETEEPKPEEKKEEEKPVEGAKQDIKKEEKLRKTKRISLKKEK